jgi:triacylglycerol esterase/lipase EstA (alpha/beta hydrolase family)
MWTAVALWLTNGIGLALYIALAAYAVARGAPLWPFIVGAPVVYLGLIALFCLIYFVLAWAFRAERPVYARIGLRATARMIWQEFWTLAGSAPRMMFYRLLMPDPPPAPAQLPVLLLHGVLCNAGVWTPFAHFLASHDIRPVYALSYGPPLASIEDFADQVAAKIDDILAATGAAQVVVVGHSMGGLVARAYLRKYGGTKVRRLITLGSPHAGSVHAWFFRGTSMAQMRPRNAWLSALAQAPAQAKGPRIVSLWSWHDSMVAPQTSGRLEGAKNVELTGIGHNALLSDSRVFERVLEEIRDAATEGQTRSVTSESPA